MRPHGWIAVGFIMFALAVALIQQTAGGVFDIYDDGTLVAQRAGINLVSGRGVEVTSADDPGDTRVNLTVGVTARSGNATVGANVTTLEVTHGLGATPTRVLLSPTADTEGVRWWVSATTTTTFTIDMNATTTADVSFDWRAQQEE
jgi:hypothetical protein